MGNCIFRNEIDSFQRESSICSFEEVRIHNPSWTNRVHTDRSCICKIPDQTLKTALTHPCIIQYFQLFCCTEDCEELLDFYLRAVEIRKLYKLNNIEESISKFEELVKLYLKSESLALNESSRIESIRGDSSLIFRSKPQCRSFILDHLKQDGSVNRATFPFAMEGLRKAQYQTFFTIKQTLWYPFCCSDLYKMMIMKKEIRTLISLTERLSSSPIDFASDPQFIKIGKSEASGMSFSSRSCTLTTSTSFSCKYSNTSTSIDPLDDFVENPNRF